MTLRNNAFMGNTSNQFAAALGGGTYGAPAGNVFVLEHNTFLGNASPYHVAALLEATVTMVGNVVSGSTSTVGDVSFADYGTSTVGLSYNAWFDNVGGGDADFALGATDLVGVDPMLSGVGGTCSWDRIRPVAGSPLIDGNPTLLDADGSAADIGATGGPSAP